MMIIYFQILFILLAPAMATMELQDDFLRLAGYGEEKLSTVVVSGALYCDHRRQSTLPISGASVAIWCKSYCVIRAKTDEYGEFFVDLPSHLHAIPDMEKRCRVTVVNVPKKSPCHLHAPKRKHTAPIKLSSSTNGIRAYSTNNIHLTPSHRRKTYRSRVNNRSRAHIDA